MNAYLFTGLVSEYRHGHFVDACANMILYGADQEVSAKAFEGILLARPSEEDQTPPRIEKIVSAPMLDQLLTETGPILINWPEVSEEALRVLAATSPDDQEQGYWVDCDQQVRSDNLAPDIRWLQRELPAEVQSGLNWSPSKTYFFLISVLSPPAAPVELVSDGEEEVTVDFEDAQRLVNFPQLAPKELAVVVRTENSVVAAWLWKRHALEMRLAGNVIRVDALCDVIPIGEQRSS